ncbi:hypothetical protein Cni_G18479 [Canna indica]|uniref:Rhodanese domain-containing protein n=1 Tax=Canna indica TaxID=4628 RepID=A0AAQ3QEE0_9LILI|nr:hypothetical protein Cni_G18479 [Canna indica]
MSSTCFSLSSLPLHLFPLPRRYSLFESISPVPTPLRHFIERFPCRNLATAAVRALTPIRSVYPRATSSVKGPRPNLLGWFDQMLDDFGLTVLLLFSLDLTSALKIFAYGICSCIKSMASEASDGEAGVLESVPVTVAHALLKSGHRYLDVRTVEEFSGGHAVGAVNIPYMLRSSSGMSKNPKFMEEVLSTFEKDDRIIVGCLSGKRSFMAASELSKAGFTAITDISGGYSAWVENGLPTDK